VEVKWRRRATQNPKELVNIILGSFLSPTTYANNTVSGQTTWVTYGGNKDMWGTEWTVADINSPQFGTAYKGYCDDSCNNLAKQHLVVYVRVAVHYSNHLFL
jgi:hypothetical protein